MAWDAEATRAAAQAVEPLPAEELALWALERFGPELVLAVSFGPEDLALLDLFARLGRFPRVVTLDTGRLPQETHDLIAESRRRWPELPLETRHPDPESLSAMVDEHGTNLFYESLALRRLCCRVRKIEPLGRALRGAPAWMAGLRRAHSAERGGVAKLEWDEQFGLPKLSPLADWSDERLWTRIRERGLPYNRLHKKGYTSIGCAPCTRPNGPGEDPRAGRWWWELASVKECGLHRPPD